MTSVDSTTWISDRGYEYIQAITAVICTRNRGDNIVQTVESILANTFSMFELLVVDQSTDERTANAIAPYLADVRVRYMRSDTKGLGRARNIGLRAASTNVVAFTDDDCTVPTDWLEKIQLVFNQHPGVAVVFCSVEAAPHDARAGFIPAYCPRGSVLLSKIRDKCATRGMGAGLAVRRSTIVSIGGFDEMLGAGAQFQAAEDDDIAVRSLLMGYHVYETNTVSILHFGFRTLAEGKQLALSSWIGLGAAYAKPLKVGCWRAWVIPAHEFFVVIVGSIVRDMLHLRRPRGFKRIPAFVRGFIQGFKMPIDRDTLCFRPSR